jgi:transcription elongation factor Elf1
MSESQLQKEFREEDIQRMRNIITGNTAGATRIQTGYTKKHIERSEGDIWEENGKTWTINNGLKQTVTKHDKLRELVKMPFKCPECERAMKANKLNKKMWVIHKKCFNCVIEYETTLKATGQYEEYAKNIMNANKNTFADDYEAAVKEYETAQPDTYVSEAGDIENWVGGKANPEIIKALKANIKQLRELEL